MYTFQFKRLVMITLILAVPFAAFAAPIGKARGGGSSIEWQLSVQGHDRVEVRVLTPSGDVLTREFKGNQRPSLQLQDVDMQFADGTYNYEVRVYQKVTPDVAKKLEAARAANDEAAAKKIAKAAGLSEQTLSGSFTILNNSIVDTDGNEGSAKADDVASSLRDGDTRVQPNVQRPSKVAVDDTVIPDDLIVQGSACVGFDCVADESFGFDTIRLKENNLRIKAEDTSASAGFPTNDWQITFNDSASGGAEKFSVDDVTNALTPFTIEALTPTNSLYVDSTGRIGFRTATPVLDLHVVTGNTPALRLEQTNAGGFTAQTWDIGANEANFFVRDVTGGSRLPLRIRPGAPTSSIDISASGKVGVGTASPAVALDLRAATVTSNHFIGIGTDPLAGPSFNIGYAGASYGRSAGLLNVQGDTSATAPNPSIRFAIANSIKVILDNEGYLGLGSGVTNPTAPIEHESGAKLTTAGVWTSVSSRAAKQDITELSSDDAFQALDQLNPVTFAYKVEPTDQQVGFIAEEVPEIVAQPNHKTLNSMEIVAVLTKVVKEQQKTIDELTKKVDQLSTTNTQQ